MVEVLRKELSEGFDEAVQKIEQICNDEGFTVMLTKSVDEIFAKKLGAKDYPQRISEQYSRAVSLSMRTKVGSLRLMRRL
jgi:UTP-glucose-1-phosphate uridylyltransferase